MSDNKDTQNDDVEFSQDELNELKKQGIDDAELEKLVKTVNDELSDNANEKDDEKDDDKEIETKKETDNKDINKDIDDNQKTQNDDKENNTPKDGVNADHLTKQHDNNTLTIINNATNVTHVNGITHINKNNLPTTPIDNNSQNKDDELQDDELNNDKSNTDKDKQTQKTEQQQADIVRTLIAKKHSQKTIDHKEVRINIEAGALPTKMFFLMNGLSAVIAGYGLLANSPAVVIGAMLVAMMLSPITSAALAVIDARLSLLKTSLITLIGGVLVIYAIGMGLGFLHGDNVMTGEILARTSPTTMDLMVALAGGAAGAYAMVSPNLSVAVVGVAVATALVPPLAASGILLASGHLSLAWGRFCWL